MSRNYSRIACLVTLGLILLLLDFLSKVYIYQFFLLNHSAFAISHFIHPIFDHFLGIDFSISLVTNRGAAWGMFADFQLALVAIRFIVIMGMLFYLIFFNQNPINHAPIVIILSGAIGNVLDYFFYGYVIDFLSFNFWGYQFPIFNLADTWITIGVIWLFWSTYSSGRRPKVGEKL